MSAPVTFTKKVAASDMKLAATWWTRRGSNPRPPRCERGALPAEPRAHLYSFIFAATHIKIPHSPAIVNWQSQFWDKFFFAP